MATPERNATMNASPPLPYIGVTGIVTPEDVLTVKDCVRVIRDHCPKGEDGLPTHRFMAGVLVSYKTLTDQPLTNRRYPHRAHVEPLLAWCLAAGAWPVIHFNTHAKGEALLKELFQLCVEFPSARGLQLNLVCPDPEVVRGFTSAFHHHVEVILQINHTSLVKSAKPPQKMAQPLDYALGYAKWSDAGISHALLDASGGKGKLFDHRTADTIIETLGHLKERGVRLGLAGGLGPDCGTAIDDLKAGLAGHGGDPDIELQELSYDSESRVRVPVPDPIAGEKYQDMLDRTKALNYTSVLCAAL